MFKPQRFPLKEWKTSKCKNGWIEVVIEAQVPICFKYQAKVKVVDQGGNTLGVLDSRGVLRRGFGIDTTRIYADTLYGLKRKINKSKRLYLKKPTVSKQLPISWIECLDD